MQLLVGLLRLICSLFENAFGNSDHIVSNDLIMMNNNGKGCGRK
jgi:hypothetical protein